MSLGDRIRTSRKSLRLTQKQLAAKIGIDHTTISKWESDTYEPDTKSLNMLAEIFSVSTDYLIDGHDKITSDFDPEVRSLARDIKNLQSSDKELLKDLIKSMQKRGKKALDE